MSNVTLKLNDPRRNRLAGIALGTLMVSAGLLGCSPATDEAARLDLAPLASPAAVGQDNGSLIANVPLGVSFRHRSRPRVEAFTVAHHSSRHGQ